MSIPAASSGADEGILIVPSTSAASGVVTYVGALAQLLSDLPLAYATVPDSDLAASLPAGVTVLRTSGDRSDLARCIREHWRNFKIVQTHGARALLAARMARVPSRRIHHVFHELPHVQGARGWGEVLLAQGAHQVVTSHSFARRLRRFGVRASTVLTPVVSRQPLRSRDEALAALDASGADLLLGVVGRLDRAKDPRLALEAVGLLPPRMRSRMTLAFIGDGPLKTELRERASELAVRTLTPGRVPAAASLLRAFDLVITPSKHESFCLTLAEAVMAGVPVVAVDSVGSRVLTDDGRLLPLVAPTPQALGRAIQAVENGGLRTTSELEDYVESRFGPRAASEAYRNYFTTLTYV